MLTVIGRRSASRGAVVCLCAMLLACAKTESTTDSTQLTARVAPGVVDDADKRTVIEVDAATRAAVMTEMRTMLKGVQGIVIGAVNRDTAAIRAAALTAGMRAASENDPAIQTQLGGDFIQLGMRTHAAFDILAADVARGNQDAMLRRLATIMGNCVGCHEQWRLTVAQ